MAEALAQGEQRGETMRRGTRIVVVMVAVVLTATGCLSGTANITVRGDGSGEFKVEVFPPGETRRALSKVETSKLIGESFGDFKGAEVDEIKKDGRSGFRITVPFKNPEQAKKLLTGGLHVSGHSVRIFAAFDLHQLPDTDRWVFRATANTIEQIFAPFKADKAFAPVTRALQDGTDASEAVKSADLEVSISLPGRLASSNADSIDGGTAKWKITDPAAPRALRANSVPQDFPTALQTILGIAVLVMLIGLVLVMVGKRSAHTNSIRRLSRLERKEIKARTAAAAGWGPRGASATPTGPAPSSETGTTHSPTDESAAAEPAHSPALADAGSGSGPQVQIGETEVATGHVPHSQPSSPASLLGPLGDVEPIPPIATQGPVTLDDSVYPVESSAPTGPDVPSADGFPSSHPAAPVDHEFLPEDEHSSDQSSDQYRSEASAHVHGGEFLADATSGSVGHEAVAGPDTHAISGFPDADPTQLADETEAALVAVSDEESAEDEEWYPEAGWYTDPDDDSRQRWWSGVDWTEYVQ